MGCAEPFRELQAFGHEVGGEHAQAAQLQEPRKDESNGPLPCHQDVIAFEEVEHPHGFEHGVYRFEEGAFEEAVFGWDFHYAGEHKGHDADVLSEATACRFETGGNASALVNGALRKSAVRAGVALQTGDVMVQGNAITGLEIPNGTADADNGTGRFVPVNPRGREEVVLDFLNVGWANTAGGHFDEQLPCPNPRDGQLLENDAPLPAINRGAHGFWNLERHGLYFTPGRAAFNEKL